MWPHRQKKWKTTSVLLLKKVNASLTQLCDINIIFKLWKAIVTPPFYILSSVSLQYLHREYQHGPQHQESWKHSPCPTFFLKTLLQLNLLKTLTNFLTIKFVSFESSSATNFTIMKYLTGWSSTGLYRTTSGEGVSWLLLTIWGSSNNSDHFFCTLAFSFPLFEHCDIHSFGWRSFEEVRVRGITKTFLLICVAW